MKKGDTVLVTHAGRTVEATVLLVDKYDKAGAVSFEAILGGYVGMMPILTTPDGRGGLRQEDLINGAPVDVSHPKSS